MRLPLAFEFMAIASARSFFFKSRQKQSRAPLAARGFATWEKTI
jgi:hypothetical protein